MFEELLEQLRQGKFVASGYTVKLPSGKKLWTENGWLSYKFYPSNNTSLSIKEKWQLRKAIKEGKMRQILAKEILNDHQ